MYRASKVSSARDLRERDLAPASNVRNNDAAALALDIFLEGAIPQGRYGMGIWGWWWENRVAGLCVFERYLNDCAAAAVVE